MGILTLSECASIWFDLVSETEFSFSNLFLSRFSLSLTLSPFLSFSLPPFPHTLASPLLPYSINFSSSHMKGFQNFWQLYHIGQERYFFQAYIYLSLYLPLCFYPNPFLFYSFSPDSLIFLSFSIPKTLSNQFSIVTLF